MVISDKKPRLRKPRKNLKRNLFICALLFVPMLHFLVFWLYINAKTISLAFMDWNYFANAYEFVGIDNFIEQFRNFRERPETMNMFINAFRAIPINIGCLVLATIIGYAFSKHIRGEKVFRVIFYLPSMISIMVGLGYLLSLVVKLITKADERTTNLVSSGLLGGEGIAGVIVSIISMFG